MNINKEFYYHLDKKKIEINWNKNPIPMKLFMSFLKVPVCKINNHLGSSTGWTKFENEEYNLIIKGGICDGGHWLHDLQYGNKLHNTYNNYVNPFYIFDILTDEGKRFFVDYYKKEIKELLKKQQDKVISISEEMKKQKELLSKIKEETKNLFSI